MQWKNVRGRQWAILPSAGRGSWMDYWKFGTEVDKDRVDKATVTFTNEKTRVTASSFEAKPFVRVVPKQNIEKRKALPQEMKGLQSKKY